MTGGSIKRWTACGLLGLGGIVLTLMGLDRLLPPPLERIEHVSAVVLDRHGEVLRIFPVEEGRWRVRADLDQIDPLFIAALIDEEDKRFFTHLGVDPLAVARAVADAIRHGEIRSGASTITMQTARLLSPRPRTIGAKIIESLRAVQLEWRYSKREILEIYLTLTPYGGNLEGLEAASHAWFGRPPTELTPSQIALLIALPQAPEARRPDRRPRVAEATRANILRQMAEMGHIASDIAEEAAHDPLPEGRHPFPDDAWHAADRALRTVTAQGDLGVHARIQTNLDASLQRTAQALLHDAAEEAGEGVQASAIIVDRQGRAIRALVGSAGRDRAGGWLDLTARPRSPGSTLKPIIYGMAFDDGRSAPETVITDLPARFAGYRPENFDRTFRGEVTISQALQHSLNVPAVHALDAIGANRFISALRFSGSDLVVPERTDVDIGLAVALGGLGLSAHDLAILYAALGDGGQALPLTLLADAGSSDVQPDAYQLMSAESASEIVDILKGSPAPPGRMPADLTTGAPLVGYKTGTSYGFRDAWAAGVVEDYTIIVWVGRPDGAPRPGKTGRQVALPILFDLADLLVHERPAQRTTVQMAALPSTPEALQAFRRQAAPPEILFPPEDAEVWADAEEAGFVLAARGQRPLRWFADGAPVPTDPSGAPLWQPAGPGFYDISVVDAEGRSATSTVRVLMPAG